MERTINDPEVLIMPVTPRERWQMEIAVLAVQCAIALVYCVGAFAGVFHMSELARNVSVVWIVAMHVPQAWYVARYRARGHVIPMLDRLMPLMDVTSVSAAWIAVGDPDSYIWTVYLYALVGYSRRLQGREYLAVAAFVIANLVCGAVALRLVAEVTLADANILVLAVVAAGIAAVSHLIGSAWQRAESRARMLAETDPLTGVPNRRTFMERLETLDADGEVFSVLMVDLDNFKKLNDEAGHLEGDRVLTQVARTLAAHLRPGDWLARYGGEEFVVVLPGSDGDEAAAIGERLRAAVATETRTTVSVGSAARRAGEAGVRVLRRADDLLLVAKRTGKDVVAADRELRQSA